MNSRRASPRSQWWIALGSVLVTLLVVELGLELADFPARSYPFLSPEPNQDDFVTDRRLFWRVVAWLSDALRERPARTPFGSFRLAPAPKSRKAKSKS